MAVHVIRRPNNYINTGLFNTAFGILGDQLNGMANRSAEAKKIADSRNDWKTVYENMEPRDGLPYPEMGMDVESGYFGDVLDNSQASNFGRDIWANSDGLGKAQEGNANDLARAMSLTKNPSGIFDPALKLFQGRLDNQEKMNYARRISDEYQSRGGYDRKNENQTMGNMIFADVAGATPGNYAAQVAPNMQGQIVDTGNKQVPMMFNPITGEYTQGNGMDVGVNPSIKYQSDTGLAQTKLNVAASRAAAGAHPKFSLVQGEDGQIYAFDQRTGGVYQNGQLVPNAKGAGKSVNTKDMLTIAKQILPLVQGAATPEEAWGMLESYSGGNKQMLQLMAETVFGMQEVPNDMFSSTPNKFYGKHPAQYQAILGGGEVPPAPSPQPQPAGQGYGGYGEADIQAAMRQFGLSREQVIAQMDIEMAQRY